MANFFTSTADLLRWVKDNNSSHKEASAKLIAAIGNMRHEQDIIETTNRIFSNRNVENAADVLFNLLSQYDITSKTIKHAEVQYDKQIASTAIAYMTNVNNAQVDASVQQHASHRPTGLQKEAQIMRQPGQYDMDLRVCPKLPGSVGKRLISTYNCRHYCLDGITFDDDPDRVYCGETMWRKHVLDKFSREWQDPKTGEWVGGYINSRFYVFPDAGTPGNPDVDRCHGNKMSLAPWERSRQPKKHEWSMERRLEEQRNPSSTKSITLHNVVANAKNTITITANDVNIKLQKNANKNDDDVMNQIFSNLVDMHNEGKSPEEAIATVAGKYKKPIERVAVIHDVAMRKMSAHQADAYKFSQHTTSVTPNTFFAFPEDVNARVERNGVLKEGNIAGLPVRPSDSNAIAKVFNVYDPKNIGDQAAPVARAYVESGINVNALRAFDELQQGADDVGLVEHAPQEMVARTKSPDVTQVPDNQESEIYIESPAEMPTDAKGETSLIS